MIVPSMWFWSVSWSTNCPVFFSFFLVDQKKFVQPQGIFGQSLGIFGRPNFFLVYQKFPETGQFIFGRTKKNEKKTEQLVDQETDQNHMDGTIVGNQT